MADVSYRLKVTAGRKVVRSLWREAPEEAVKLWQAKLKERLGDLAPGQVMAVITGQGRQFIRHEDITDLELQVRR